MSKTCIVPAARGSLARRSPPGWCSAFDRVIAFDNLLAQVHGDTPRPPELDPAVELYRADVREAQAWTTLLDTVDAVDTVIDLAAETGTGNPCSPPPAHQRQRGGHLPDDGRSGADREDSPAAAAHQQPGHLRRRRLAKRGGGDFLSRPAHGRAAGRRAVGLPRRGISARQRRLDPAHPTSVYGATKLCQEHLLKAWGGATGTQVKIVRLQNVYGPGQSLINAYTGIVPLFARMAKAGQSIPLYEDGQIVRDFVLIDDVRDAILAALDRDSAAGQTIDIGTGRMTTIADVAQVIAPAVPRPGAPCFRGLPQRGRALRRLRRGARPAAAGFPGTARPGGRAEPAVPVDRRHPGRRLNYDRFPLASFG